MAVSSDSIDKHPRISFRSIPDFDNASTIEPTENFLAREFNMRPRSLSHHLHTDKVPSRSWLRIQANFWRTLMRLGMQFHDYAPPKPPKAHFKRRIATNTIPIELYFYLPPNYQSTLQRDPSYQFPAVVNFHGGGFCLGDATDDRYWARVVLEATNAIFVSVNYRRAPEQPFPVPIDDGIEALLYISRHTSDLHIDASNIALSGFSAGGNLAFAVPLRMVFHRKLQVTASKTDPDNMFGSSGGAVDDSGSDTPTEEATFTDIEREQGNVRQRDFATSNIPTPQQSTTRLLRDEQEHPITIKSIVAWYPLLDFTTSRSQKKRESRNPKKCLPKVFTDLFDHSYLPPPDNEGHHASPYASPGLASDHMIKTALPKDIQLWLCEWDMLLAEGQAFSNRLEKLGKNLDTKIIPNVPHGWDKSPSPFRDQAATNKLYEIAAKGLHDVFYSPSGLHRLDSSLRDDDSIIERQPRPSIRMG